MSESGQFVMVKKKQMDFSFSCVCPVIDNEFRHNIVKVVCGFTRLSPCGSPASKGNGSIPGLMSQTDLHLIKSLLTCMQRSL